MQMSPICIKINTNNEKKSVGKMVFFGIVFSVLPGLTKVHVPQSTQAERDQTESLPH